MYVTFRHCLELCYFKEVLASHLLKISRRFSKDPIAREACEDERPPILSPNAMPIGRWNSG